MALIAREGNVKRDQGIILDATIPAGYQDVMGAGANARLVHHNVHPAGHHAFSDFHRMHGLAPLTADAHSADVPRGNGGVEGIHHRLIDAAGQDQR